jgi:hypothetical protein
METLIAILLGVIVVQIYFVLSRLLNIHRLMLEIKNGLFGGGYGAISKLSFLESIHTNLEKLVKNK